MESYTVYGPYGGKPAFRKSTVTQNAHGLYYFVADYNKAKTFDSVHRYKLDADDGHVLRFVDYRRKKYIDNPVRSADAVETTR
jgi:hypothetical protein